MEEMTEEGEKMGLKRRKNKINSLTRKVHPLNTKLGEVV